MTLKNSENRNTGLYDTGPVLGRVVLPDSPETLQQSRRTLEAILSLLVILSQRPTNTVMTASPGLKGLGRQTDSSRGCSLCNRTHSLMCLCVCPKLAVSIVLQPLQALPSSLRSLQTTPSLQWHLSCHYPG